MQIKRSLEESIAILEPIGDMGLYNLAELRKLLDELRTGGNTKILINMAGVPGIDSTCIGFLLMETNQFQESGGALKLAHISANVRKSLQMTETLSQLSVYENVADALAAFQPKR